MKLKKAIDRYERSITVEATRVLYGYTLASLLDYLGNAPLSAISTDDLRGWKISQEQRRSESSRNRGKKKKIIWTARRRSGWNFPVCPKASRRRRLARPIWNG